MSKTVVKQPEFKTMTLSECAEYDFKHGLKNKLTGWGIICKDRCERGVSRRAMREKNKG